MKARPGFIARLWLRLALLAGAALTGGTLLHGADREKEEPLPRPASELIPLRGTILEEQIDGMIARETEAVGGGVRIRMPAYSGWYLQSDPRYSLRITNRSRPSIYMALSLFREEAFLPELTPATIRRHVRHLQNTLGDRFVLLNPGTDFAIEDRPSRPLNEPGLRLIYKILSNDPEAGPPEVHKVTFVLLPNDLLLELRLVTPEPFFEPVSQEYGAYIRGTYLVE
ncbi:MAG: hypothetical protein ACFE0O_14175 [Opitutales bacterium]